MVIIIHLIVHSTVNNVNMAHAWRLGARAKALLHLTIRTRSTHLTALDGECAATIDRHHANRATIVLIDTTSTS
jgi:hypothetical protein